MNDKLKYYYGLDNTTYTCRGVVYHYDDTGNRQIRDFETEECRTEEEAIDLAAEWMEEHGIDGELT